MLWPAVGHQPHLVHARPGLYTLFSSNGSGVCAGSGSGHSISPRAASGQEQSYKIGVMEQSINHEARSYYTTGSTKHSRARYEDLILFQNLPFCV